MVLFWLVVCVSEVFGLVECFSWLLFSEASFEFWFGEDEGWCVLLC